MSLHSEKPVAVQKRVYYLIEGLNALAASLYVNYLFFFMQAKFGFESRHNLGLAALSGLFYMVGSRAAGKLADRYGFRPTLGSGIMIMLLILCVGLPQSTVFGNAVILVIYTVGMCLTWPALEALISENESPSRLPKRVGVYNLTWAGGAAIAYFIGGAMVEHLGFRSLFWVPALIHLGQLLILRFAPIRAVANPLVGTPKEPVESSPLERCSRRNRLFLNLSWVANPLAFMAIFTVTAIIPDLAHRHQLSPMWAGFFCSLWLFARWLAFLLLWRWPGWHYRPGWFAGSYVLLIASFISLLLAPNLWILLIAELALGAAAGLFYYSSLFYSMDVGVAHGEHGGIHESAIGAGIFAGPAIGGIALWIWPEAANAAAWAVTSLLAIGGLLLAYLYWSRSLRPVSPLPSPRDSPTANQIR